MVIASSVTASCVGTGHSQHTPRPILLMEQEGANCTHRNSAVNALSPSDTTGTSGSPVSLTVELVTAPVSRLSAGHQQAVTAFCWSPTSCHGFLLVTNKLSRLSAGHQQAVTAFCWSPTRCHGFLLVTNKMSRLSAGHQQAVTAFCWSPTQQGSLCQCAGHHLFPHNTTAAKTLQRPKHLSCQNTADAKTLQLPKHHSCQNTADAKTPHLPKHRRCQNTTDAKTPQMPNGMNWNGTTLLGTADNMLPSFTDRCDIYTLPRTLWHDSLHLPTGVTYNPEHCEGLTVALLTRFSCFTNRCNMPTAPLTSLSHTLTEKTYRSLPHPCLLHHHWSTHQP